MKTIKNIIFDLGGVLINLDATSTKQCFGENITTFLGQDVNPLFFDILCKYERGEITSDVFRKKTSEIFNFSISNEIFDKCWNAMIGDMPANRIAMLRELKKKYNLFLLSNTNSIHCDYFTKQDYWDDGFFTKTYYSHVVGMRKPEQEIFNFVLNENNLLPNETLFVDDTKDNILAARELGINSLLVDREIEDILRDFL